MTDTSNSKYAKIYLEVVYEYFCNSEIFTAVDFLKPKKSISQNIQCLKITEAKMLNGCCFVGFFNKNKKILQISSSNLLGLRCLLKSLVIFSSISFTN